MNIRADTNKENQNKPVADLMPEGTRHVHTNSGIALSSPGNESAGKSQTMADNSPGVKQLKALQGMADKYASKQKKNVIPPDTSPVQAKFIGPESVGLTSLNFGILDPRGDLSFTQFYKQLSDSKENIIVQHAGDTSYDAGRKVLSINPSLLANIDKYIRQKMYGVKPGDSAVTGDDIVSMVSTISHELSHARDHIISGKNISENTLAVLDTELRAWAVEALDAIKLSGMVKGNDPYKTKLIHSWLEFSPDMLRDPFPHAETNEVAGRLTRYIIRGIKSRSEVDVRGWISDNRGALDTQIEKLKTAVVKRFSAEEAELKAKHEHAPAPHDSTGGVAPVGPTPSPSTESAAAGKPAASATTPAAENTNPE